MLYFFHLRFHLLLALSTRLAYNNTCFNETKTVYYIDTDIPAVLPPVRTLIGGWQSATASMYMTKIVLEEKMGVEVQLWPTDSDDYDEWYEWDYNYPVTQYQWLANQSVDYIIEGWDMSRKRPEIVAWFKAPVIKEIGNLGTLGQMYVFLPRYTNKLHPDVGYFESLQNEDIIDIFLDDMLFIFDKYKNQTGFFSRYVNWTEGDPNRFLAESATNLTNQTRPFIIGAKLSYTMSRDLWDRMNMLNLSDTWDLWLVQSEEILTSLMKEMTEANMNFLANLYSPTNDLGQFDLEKINFPYPQDATCYDDKTCEAKIVVLFKTMNIQSTLDFPEVETFMRNVRFDSIAINSIMADSNKYENSTTRDSVCSWLLQNEDIWSEWIVEIDRELPIRLNTDTYLMIFMFVVTSFLIVFTGAALRYLLKHKDQPLVRAVSPQFLALAAISGIIIAMAGVFWTFDDYEHGLIMCSVRWIFSCTGNTLLFGSLSLKTWRVYRIFNNMGRTRTLSNAELYFYLVLVLIPVAGLLIWKSSELNEKGLDYQISANGIEYQYQCPFTESGRYLVISQIILASFALILCVKARDIPDDFNEIVHIMYLCIFTMLLIGFALMVFQTAGSTPKIRAVIACLSHFCVAIVIEISVLGRTVYLLLSGKANRAIRSEVELEGSG